MAERGERLQRFLTWSQARPVRNGILFATLLCLPTVLSGWMLDDWIHRAAILGRIPIHHPDAFTLFTFGNGVKADVMARTQFGYGWWTLPDLRLQFFRPLSSLTHIFDETVLGPHAWLQHVHSLLWQAAGIAASAAIFRRLLAPRTATLATLLYAVDESHWTATWWLSNRNAWVSMVPAMLGFWAWLRAEDEDWLPGKIAAPLLFGVGLCGGETALGVAAIWVAVAIGKRTKPLFTTLLHLAPLGLVLTVWATYYKAHGYGAAASGAYLDPGAEPLRYLGQAVHRIPSLAGALIASMPVELAVVSPTATWIVAILSAVCIWLVVRGLRLLPLDPRDRRIWPPLAVGALLALVPPASTWASQRTLLAPSLVSAAFVAMLLLGLANFLKSQPGLRSARWGRGTLVGIHLVWSPLVVLLLSVGVALVAPGVDNLSRSEALAKVGGKHVVLLAAPDPVLSFYLPAMMASADLALPRQFNTLAVSEFDVAVTRTAPNRIRLEAQLPTKCKPFQTEPCLGAPLLSTQPEQLIMDPARMPHAGDVIEVPHLRVRVEQATPAGVTQVEFEFDEPLERLIFLRWHEGALHISPPPTETRELIRHEIGVMGV